MKTGKLPFSICSTAEEMGALQGKKLYANGQVFDWAESISGAELKLEDHPGWGF